MTRPVPEIIKQRCRETLLMLSKYGYPLGNEFDPLDIRLGFASLWGAMAGKFGESEIANAQQLAKVSCAMMEFLRKATDEEMLSLRDEFNRQASSRSN